MSVQQRRQYDPESKRNKVLLTKEPNRSVRDVAESPGISPDLLYQWRQQHRDQGEIAFPGQGNLALTPDQKRIRTVCGKLTECGLTPCPPLWRKLNSNVHTAINPQLNELMPGISWWIDSKPTEISGISLTIWLLSQKTVVAAAPFMKRWSNTSIPRPYVPHMDLAKKYHFIPAASMLHQ